ncbi:MAG: RNA-binding protein [Acidobacteria bacterium]|nr:RNA-binding protein [Acidobacteriota bacterium]
MGRIAPAARSGASRSKELPISSRVFVGNLQYETSAQELETLFSQVGKVVEVVLPVDRMTDRPRGFAFVEFGDASAVAEAINRFDGTEFGGRMLQVSEARERAPRAPFGGGDSGGGGGWTDDRPSRKPARPKGSRRGVRARKRGF